MAHHFISTVHFTGVHSTGVHSTGAHSTVRREAWPKKTVVVPAVFREWDDAIPAWACPDSQQKYVVTTPFYQRLDASAPRFVPNNGYELGVFLRFIVDHYSHLPERVVFLQADADTSVSDLAHRLNSLEDGVMSAASGYLPLNDALVRNRSLAKMVYWRPGHPLFGIGPAVARCWELVLHWFGRAAAIPNIRDATVSFFCCNMFAVSRENIEQHSLATWRLAYERVVEKGSCAGDSEPDAWHAKHTAAGAFEHLSPLIWGTGSLSQSPAHFNGPSWSTLVGSTRRV